MSITALDSFILRSFAIKIFRLSRILTIYLTTNLKILCFLFREAKIVHDGLNCLPLSLIHQEKAEVYLRKIYRLQDWVQERRENILNSFDSMTSRILSQNIGLCRIYSLCPHHNAFCPPTTPCIKIIIFITRSVHHHTLYKNHHLLTPPAEPPLVTVCA